MLMRLDSLDNVAVCLEDCKAGEVRICGDITVQCQNDIPFGHKCALRDIVCGEKIIKYGCPIGYATQDIRQGELVRENNMKGLRGRGDLEGK